MKQILVIFLALIPMAGLADINDQDFLLTPAGTLYTIESIPGETAGPGTDSIRALRLTAQQGTERTTNLVPSSRKGGLHSDPSLAYDADTDTLFLFWQRMPNLMSSELLVSSFTKGEWSAPTSIDNSAFHMRSNLRIGVTRFVTSTDKEGKTVKTRELTVHATWWDTFGGTEAAHYAMLTVEKGLLTSVQRRPLLSFLGSTEKNRAPADIPSDYDRELFRHPAIFEIPGHDAVDILFADVSTNRFHRVEIQPTKGADGVLRLPIGMRTGEFNPPKRFLAIEAEAPLLAIRSPGSNSLLLYTRGKDRLDYVLLRDGVWSDLQTLALGEHLSVESGVEALRRLITSD